MIKRFIKRYNFIIYIAFSFYILDLFIRYINLDVNLGSIYALAPNFFTLAWISFFISIILMLKPKGRKITYITIIMFFYLILFVNFIFFSLFNNFFNFGALTLANEGVNYFKMIFSHINWSIVLVYIGSITLLISGLRFMPKDKLKKDVILAILFLIIAISSFGAGRHFLGQAVSNLEWDAWNHKKNVYDSYSDTKRSLQVSGLYEYTIRDFWLSMKPTKKAGKEEIKYLDNYFSSSIVTMASTTSNEMKGILKDKNVILVLMESIDNWLVTDEVMPTLYKMMHEGINFTNHFSPIYVGGATFNAEFTINTGYMTPFNGGVGAYFYSNNVFPYSLANLLRDDNYKYINEFHMNKAEFYNRGNMAKAFGYDNYYGSYDMHYGYTISNRDSHFMEQTELKNLILPDNDKFMSFIVTYSAHLPYALDSAECQLVIPDNDRLEAKKDEEMNCIRAQAHETDNFFALLLDALAEKNLLNNTIIIGVTDHFAYGFSDTDRLKQLKSETDANLICKVPFFIWGEGIKKQEIDKVNSNLDVLPTLNYLLGLKYNPKYYIGSNIFDDNYKGLVFFSDYSWYDGNIYYRNGDVIRGDNVDEEYVKETSVKINTILDINKKVLDTNYFSTHNKK